MAVGCRRCAALFTAVGGAVYTTAMVNTARFSAVGVGVMVHILCCCWCRLLRYGECKWCPFFGPSCNRCGALFIAFGATFYATARVNSACFSSVGVDVMLPILLLLVPLITLRRG